MKKRVILVIVGLSMVVWQCIGSAPSAKADYFNYPCQPPGIGIGADVNIIVDAGGQFCDGPTEINLAHLHCESGGATVNIGGFALAPLNGGPLSVGGIGGNGTGGHGGGCSWRCPDNTLAPAPNPPGVYTRSYIDVTAIIKRNKAFCVVENHLAPAGPTSALVSPDEGFPDDPTKPWQQPGGVPMPNTQMPPPRIDAEPAPEPNNGPPSGETNIPIPNIPSATPPIPLPGPIPDIPSVLIP